MPNKHVLFWASIEQLFFVLFVLLLSMPAPEEHTTGYTVRTARTTDVDDITEVVVSVFDQTPIYPYRFPGAKEYPEDYARHTRLHQSVYLANVDSGAYAGWVAEVPVKRNRSKVIAYSYWQMADFDSRPRW
jgi:hypothetical protein